MSRFLIAISCLVTWAVPSSSAAGFTDATEEWGLSFTHAQAATHRSGPMGGGACVGDFDNDRYPDLFVIGGGDAPDALFINRRGRHFENRAGAWGVDHMHRGTGCAVGDVDGDGDDDLFVTSMGDMSSVLPVAGHHRLYLNQGGHFVEQAAAAGVARTTDYPDGYGAAFGDYDLDGDLDLFVAAWHLTGVTALGSRLFRNRGDGTFDEVTAAAGVAQRTTQAFAAIFADMDGDRWPELLVAGDFGTSRYYRNNGDGTFSELDPGRGATPVLADDPNWSVGKAHNGMGTTLADFDRDGRPDWFVTAIWPTFYFESPHWGNGLYLNRGGHVFDEVAGPAGVADGGWGWGTAAADFDHDGRVDIAMTNGWPEADAVTGETFDGEASYLFVQRAEGRFEEAAAKSGLMHTQQGRGLVTLDVERDGALDVIIMSNRDALRAYRNEAAARGGKGASNAHWLTVRLNTRRRPDLAPGGLGAEVRVSVGGVTQHAWLTGGGSYLGHGETLAHFGLGGARRVDEVVVTWPDGGTSVRRNVRANRHLHIAAPHRNAGGAR